MTPTKEQEDRWLALRSAYYGLGHVPIIQAKVFDKYEQLRALGMEPSDAMDQALIDHAFHKDTRPLVTQNGVLEYEDILEGDKIWADIQNSSGS